MRRLLSTAVLTLAMIGVGAISPAYGQLENLDKATLIEGLRQQRMGDLLKHLVESELRESDPVVGQQALINLLLLEYKEASDAAEQIQDGQARMNALAEARQTFYRALDEYRDLISQNYDHPQRPLWQTSLAQELLFEHLQYINHQAGEFVEYGVPTDEQRAAFNDAVIEAFEHLTAADLRLFELQGKIPNRADFTEMYQDTGLWNRMMNDFYKLRTQYFLAVAAHYAAMVPEDHAYYTTLGENEFIPAQMQKESASAERARLRALVPARTTQILETNRDLGVDPKLRSQLLKGRGLVALDQASAAMEPLQEVIDNTVGDPVNLEAKLTKAMAFAQDNKMADAMDLMTQLTAHPLLAQSPWYRLIVTDRTHLFLMKQANAIDDADQRRAAIESAYEPYLAMLENTTSDMQRQALQEYIFKRWESSLGADAKLEDLPALVLRAVVETARLNGQNMMVKARNLASEATDEEGNVLDEVVMAQAMDVRNQAMEKLNRAVAVADVVLGREEISDEQKVEALYNKAVATFFQDIDSRDNRIKTALLMAQLADEYPEAPQAAAAGGEALALLRPIFQYQQQANLEMEGMPEAYINTVENIVFAKHPDSEGAHNERLFYAFTVLRPQGRLREAADMLAGIPQDHPTYWEGQREMLYAYLDVINQLEREATQAEDESAAKLKRDEAEMLTERAIAAAEELRNAARGDLPTASAEMQPLINDAYGNARLILAELYASQDRGQNAVAVLSGFEQDHGDDPGLVSQALEKRIIALAATGEFEQMNSEARVMMAQFPDEASYVIQDVLAELEGRIIGQRQLARTARITQERRQASESAEQMANAAAQLAQQLGNWARTRQPPLSQEEKLSVMITEGQAYRLAGKTDIALERLKPARDAMPNDARVIHNLAETYYATGSQDRMIREAAPLYDEIISRVAKNEDGTYPPMWWNAWMRRLQINDKAGGEFTGDIPFRVRQLKLVDPELGGEPYKTELIRLENKYTLQ